MRPQESFIQQPIRSLQTMLQVISLDDRRIPTVIPDGIYGQTTLNAVNIFQQLYGLPITGITDQATWEKITEIYELAEPNINKAEPIEIMLNRNQIIKQGDSGPYVFFLQTMLSKLSQDHPTILDLEISGNYDEATAASVKSFQKISNLPVTGFVNKHTWKHIVKQFTLNIHHNNRNNNGNI